MSDDFDWSQSSSCCCWGESHENGIGYFYCCDESYESDHDSGWWSLVRRESFERSWVSSRRRIGERRWSLFWWLSTKSLQTQLWLRRWLRDWWRLLTRFKSVSPNYTVGILLVSKLALGSYLRFISLYIHNFYLLNICKYERIYERSSSTNVV